MRLLLSAALAASLAAGSLSAVAQTPAPAEPAAKAAKPAKPVKQKACKTFKDETTCGVRTDCAWSKPGDAKGKCKAAPKPKAA